MTDARRGYEEKCDHNQRYFGCVVPPTCTWCKAKRYGNRMPSRLKEELEWWPKTQPPPPPIGELAESLLADVEALSRAYDIKRSEVEEMVSERITKLLWRHAMQVAAEEEGAA